MAAPVAQAASIAVGARPLLPRLALAAALAVLLMLLLVVAPLALLSSAGGSATGPGAAPAGIPAAFVPIYREAAREFHLNWLLLASVHKEETGFSTHPTTYHGVNPYGCCAGPFQFNVTNGPPSTWDSHKQAYRLGRRPADYPHPREPHPSVYDDFDAAMAAGSLLRANGADGALGARTFQAVRAYNGAGPVAQAYAERVLDRARAWDAAARTGSSAPEESSPGRGVLTWPVQGPITSPFCERRAWESCHPGLDIAAPAGTPIRAAAAGRVSTRSWVSGYGRFTCLEHRAPLSTCYAHQSRFGPTPAGGVIQRGGLVGYVGCTGRCTGPHLHFEVRVSGRPSDPSPYLTAKSRP